MLPLELAHLVTAFLDLNDIVVLVGCMHGPANLHGLHHFLPAVEELDAYVPNSSCCLRSDIRRRNKQSRVRPGQQEDRGEQCPKSALPAAPSCLNLSACVYHNRSLRSLLLRNDEYASIAQTKLDASEALGHLSVDRGDSGMREQVTIDILETLMLRRHLNQCTVASTLVIALRLSLYDVVEWIHRHVPIERIPPKFRVNVMIATCQYDEHAVGRRVLNSLLQLSAPSAQTSRRVLVAAARHGRLETIGSMLDDMIACGLLDAGVLRDALTAAAEGGHDDTLRMILNAAEAQKFVLDATDALVCACRVGNLEIVELVLASALVTVSNAIAGCVTSPFAAAVESGVSNLVSLILADPRVNTWDPLAIQRAATHGNIFTVKQLLVHQHCRPKDVEISLRSLPRLSAQWELVYELVRSQHGRRLDAWEIIDLVCSIGNTELIEHTLSTSADIGDCVGRKYWRPLVTRLEMATTRSFVGFSAERVSGDRCR